MARRRTVYMDLEELESAPVNPKGHATALIARSIDRFGLVEVPTLDERTGKIVSGHGRRDDLLERKRSGGSPPDDVQVKAGRWLIPVSRGWASKDDDEALAAGIAVNQATIAGGWILEDLAPALQGLDALELGLDAIGFETTDIDSILASLELAKKPEEEKPPPVMPGVPKDPITKPGDLWLLGDHRLLCGDCRNPEDVDRLLAGTPVNVAITSPPYAEQRDYDEDSGFRPIKPDEYVEWFAAVAANVAAHLAEDGSWFVNIKPPGRDLDTHLYVMDLVVAHVRAWGWHFATEFCWERVGVPKKVTRRFKNQFEPIYQFARGEWKMRPENVRHASASAIAGYPDTTQGPNYPELQGSGASAILPRKTSGEQGGPRAMQPIGGPRRVRDDANRGRMSGIQGAPGGPNVGSLPRREGHAGDNAVLRLGKGGTETPNPMKARRNPAPPGSMSEVQGVNYDAGGAIGVGFAYPGNRLPTFAGSHEATGHSAAFPVGLPGWFVRAFSDEGDAIFDPFMGSGSTLLAAHETGRIGFGLELSPGYCDLTLRRFQEHTGIKPIREGSKKATDFSK